MSGLDLSGQLAFTSHLSTRAPTARSSAPHHPPTRHQNPRHRALRRTPTTNKIAIPNPGETPITFTPLTQLSSPETWIGGTPPAHATVDDTGCSGGLWRFDGQTRRSSRLVCTDGIEEIGAWAGDDRNQDAQPTTMDAPSTAKYETAWRTVTGNNAGNLHTRPG